MLRPPLDLIRVIQFQYTTTLTLTVAPKRALQSTGLTIETRPVGSKLEQVPLDPKWKKPVVSVNSDS